jgi:membrane associated rhomboid family serine protease
MFFHADTFHLIGNMLSLWVFGDNVEDAMGGI